VIGDLAVVHLPHGQVLLEDRGSGEATVLLHGMGSSHRSWYRVARELARTGRVIAPDLPGFGGSDPAGAGFRPSVVADALAAAIAARAVDDYVLVGHSLGGLVAVALADRHPARVRRLVLVSPAGLQQRLSLPGQAIGRVLETLIDVRRELGGAVATSPQARRVMFGRLVHRPERLHATDARLILEASRGATRIRQGVAAAIHGDVRPALARLAMPVEVVWGAEDRLLPVSGVALARAARPGLPVHVLHGIGHLPMLERPAELAGLIRDGEA
jgi:pyruvate dehydrogenase E2 component (dihydrolipoamide acetyltransferase)